MSLTSRQQFNSAKHPIVEVSIQILGDQTIKSFSKQSLAHCLTRMSATAEGEGRVVDFCAPTALRLQCSYRRLSAPGGFRLDVAQLWNLDSVEDHNGGLCLALF